MLAGKSVLLNGPVIRIFYLLFTDLAGLRISEILNLKIEEI